MKINDCSPFVRQVLKHSLSIEYTMDVNHKLRAKDCRIFYIISGKGSIILNNKKYDLMPASLVYIPAGEEYIWQIKKLEMLTVNFDFTSKFAYIKTSFHPDHAENFVSPLEKITFTDADCFNLPLVLFNVGYFESSLSMLLNEYYLSSGFKEEIMSCILKTVLLRIAQENSAPDNLNFNTRRLIGSVIKYVQNNYDKPLDNQEIGKTFAFSPVYINRIFKKELNVSLHEFIVNYRISVAKELLFSSAYLSQEVAQMVGFNDYPHFSKTFKKITGLSPAKYKSKR